MAVAELASHDPIGTMVAYTEGPDRYHTAYSFVFLRQSSGAAHVRTSVEEFLAASATAWPSWAFSNHDVARVVSRWGGPGVDRAAFAKLMIALLTSLRGTAFVYQGEELGLPEGRMPFERMRDPEGLRFWPEYRGRDGARTPMPWRADAPHAGFSNAEPWLPVETDHVPLAVDRQQDDPGSVLTFTRRFLAWRRYQRPLIDGEIRFLDEAEPVLAFERADADRRILCVFNLGSEAVVAPVDAFLHAACAVEPLDGPGLGGEWAAGTVRLPGHGAFFAALR